MSLAQVPKAVQRLQEARNTGVITDIVRDGPGFTAELLVFLQAAEALARGLLPIQWSKRALLFLSADKQAQSPADALPPFWADLLEAQSVISEEFRGVSNLFKSLVEEGEVVASDDIRFEELAPEFQSDCSELGELIGELRLLDDLVLAFALKRMELAASVIVLQQFCGLMVRRERLQMALKNTWMQTWVQWRGCSSSLVRFVPSLHVQSYDSQEQVVLMLIRLLTSRITPIGLRRTELDALLKQFALPPFNVFERAFD